MPRSNGNQGWFYSDGLHLRPAGAARYASLLAATVSRQVQLTVARAA